MHLAVAGAAAVGAVVVAVVFLAAALVEVAAYDDGALVVHDIPDDNVRRASHGGAVLAVFAFLAVYYLIDFIQ